jgi:hypothetical protein
MKVLSDWRSVRLWETRLERELHRNYSLRTHGILIGTFTLLLMWGVSARAAVCVCGARRLADGGRAAAAEEKELKQRLSTTQAAASGAEPTPAAHR